MWGGGGKGEVVLESLRPFICLLIFLSGRYHLNRLAIWNQTLTCGIYYHETAAHAKRLD